MPLFMWYYCVGLGLVLLVGTVFYFVVGGHIAAPIQGIFSRHGGRMWGRSFRLMLVANVVIGGLAVQWYGCGGYADYESIAQDERRMFEKTTEQVSGALRYGSRFLLVTAWISALCFAVLAHGRASKGTAKEPAGPPKENVASHAAATKTDQSTTCNRNRKSSTAGDHL